jgi:hypothetical protein
MIDLFNAARSQVSIINPPVLSTINRSNGYITAADGTRTPVFTVITGIKADVQPMTAQDLHQVDGLNIGGEKVTIFLSGELLGVLRTGQNGGDIIELANGEKYLVVLVLEQWIGWVKVAAVLQL